MRLPLLLALLLLAPRAAAATDWFALAASPVPLAQLEARLDAGQDVHARDAQGRTAAYHAAQAGRWEAVDLFLARGYDPVALVPSPQNPSHVHQRGLELLAVAVRAGRTELVERLLQLGVNPRAGGTASRVFQDPLSEALLHGHREIARLLLLAGAWTDGGATIRDAPRTGYVNQAERFIHIKVQGTGLVTLQPIHLAARSRDLELLNLLLERGHLVDTHDSPLGRTALMYAAEAGWIEGVERLLRAGANRSVQDANGRTARNFAAAHPEVRLALLRNRYGLRPAQRGTPGQELVMAIEADDETRVTALLQDPNARNHREAGGITPLMFAASWGRARVIPLLAGAGGDIHAVDRRGYSVLRFAVLEGHVEAARALLALGADPDHGRDLGFWSMLMTSIFAGRKEMASLLLAHGADVRAVESPDSRWAPPVALAAGWGDLALVKELVAQGAELHALDSYGDGVLLHACYADNPDLIAYLVAAGLDPNAPGGEGETPLARAVGARQLATVRALLAHGAKAADLGLTSTTGELSTTAGREVLELLRAAGADPTVLFWMGRPSREEIMRFVGEGGDPNFIDGETPLSVALRAGDHELARFLLAHRANPSLQGRSTRSTLHAAVSGAVRHNPPDAPAMLQELFRRGADPAGARDALESAIAAGRPDLVQALLEGGVDKTGALEQIDAHPAPLDPAVYGPIRNLLLREWPPPKRL